MDFGQKLRRAKETENIQEIAKPANRTVLHEIRKLIRACRGDGVSSPRE
jgi:hypothetical protein